MPPEVKALMSPPLPAKELVMELTPTLYRGSGEPTGRWQYLLVRHHVPPPGHEMLASKLSSWAQLQEAVPVSLFEVRYTGIILSYSSGFLKSLLFSKCVEFCCSALIQQMPLYALKDNHQMKITLSAAAYLIHRQCDVLEDITNETSNSSW